MMRVLSAKTYFPHHLFQTIKIVKVNKKVLIVEDQFVEANDLQLILKKAGYQICGIVRSVDSAEEALKRETPGIVLLDIFLKGKRTGIDLAHRLKEDNIPFIYLSANSNEEVLNAAKTTEPYGFIVKPFREKDLLVALEIAWYRHRYSLESKLRQEEQLQKKLEEITLAHINYAVELLYMQKQIQTQDGKYAVINGSLNIELTEIRNILICLFGCLYDHEKAFNEIHEARMIFLVFGNKPDGCIYRNFY